MTYGRFEQSMDRHITGNWGEDDPAVKGEEQYEALTTEIDKETTEFLATVVKLIKQYEMTDKDVLNDLFEDFPRLESYREFIEKKLKESENNEQKSKLGKD